MSNHEHVEDDQSFEGASPPAGETSPGEEASEDDVKDELNEALKDLRAELARIKFEEARDRTRTWIQENPTLAVFLAAGAGILTGRLISKALEPAPPPSLSERARRQADRIVAEAQRQAREAQQRARQQAAETGEKVTRQARDFGSVIADRAAALREQARQGVSEATEKASERARQWGARMEHEAEDVGEAVAKRAEEASERVRESARELSKKASPTDDGFNIASSALNIAKAALVTLAVKKASDWIRRS